VRTTLGLGTWNYRHLWKSEIVKTTEWDQMKKSPSLKPMPFWMSLLFFGIPFIIGWISVYTIMPALNKSGFPMFWNFWECLTLPLAGMLITALAAYRLEGRPRRWIELKSRFRLKPVKGID
jgi:hypothetical protein